jgi:hypothetical protein
LIVSDEEGHENTLAHQVLGTMHLALSPRAKGLPVLTKSQGEDTARYLRICCQATNWCQWAQDLTHQAVSEGKNRVCEAPCHCWKQAGPKELSPGVRLTS